MRRQPVAFFLGDASFLADSKFRALARRLTDDDEFNSAVGAYFIALAISRRNGSALIDVEQETGTHFAEDLLAVGLLEEGGFPPKPWKEWEAMSPQQAAAGRMRAKDAGRDEKGRFQSSETPAESSESSALASVVPLVQLVQPSPPLPSIPTLRSVSTTPRAPARDTEADAVIEDLQHAEYESSKLADIPFSELLAKPL